MTGWLFMVDPSRGYMCTLPVFFGYMLVLVMLLLCCFLLLVIMCWPGVWFVWVWHGLDGHRLVLGMVLASMLLLGVVGLVAVGAPAGGSTAVDLYSLSTNGTIVLDAMYDQDLMPGYRLVYRLQSHGVVAVTGIFSLPMGAFADSGVVVDGWVVGITGEDGLPPVSVYYRVGGELREIDNIYLGFKEYTAMVTLTAYCIGETPPGAPHNPPPGHFWVKVELEGDHGTMTDWWPVDGSTTAPRVQLYYERADLGVTQIQSFVREESVLQWKECDVTPPGETPAPGSDTRADQPPGDNDMSTIMILAAVGVVFILGLLALALVLR